jgi:hypothetical protein
MRRSIFVLLALLFAGLAEAQVGGSPGITAPYAPPTGWTISGTKFDADPIVDPLGGASPFLLATCPASSLGTCVNTPTFNSWEIYSGTSGQAFKYKDSTWDTQFTLAPNATYWVVQSPALNLYAANMLSSMDWQLVVNDIASNTLTKHQITPTQSLITSQNPTRTVLSKVLAVRGAGDFTSGTRPTCDSNNRNFRWYVQGGAGVADTYEVCGKTEADTYAWGTLTLDNTVARRSTKALYTLIEGGYALDGTTTSTPANTVTVTVVDTTPGIIDGDVQVCGYATAGAETALTKTCSTLDFATGAANHSTVATFVTVTNVKSSSFGVLGGGGDETIKAEWSAVPGVKAYETISYGSTGSTLTINGTVYTKVAAVANNNEYKNTGNSETDADILVCLLADAGCTEGAGQDFMAAAPNADMRGIHTGFHTFKLEYVTEGVAGNGITFNWGGFLSGALSRGVDAIAAVSIQSATNLVNSSVSNFVGVSVAETLWSPLCLDLQGCNVEPADLTSADDGKLLTVIGRDATNGLVFTDSANMDIGSAGAFTASGGDVLALMYNSVNAKAWTEVSRSNN